MMEYSNIPIGAKPLTEPFYYPYQPSVVDYEEILARFIRH